MSNGKLAIILPTYRFDSTAQQNIRTLAAMGSDEIGIFIADNSCNPEKWAFLAEIRQKAKNCHVFCHETNIGVFENCLFLIEAQDYEFMCLASDDDSYRQDYFVAGFEELKANPACAAASGLLVFLTMQPDGVNAVARGSNLGETPSKRVADAAGYNSVIYSVVRRSSLEKFVPYMKEKPFLAPYNDFFQTYTILCHGTYVVFPDRKIFVYYNDNWAADTAVESCARAYVNAGFPRQFYHLHALCWALEAVHYFNSIYRPYGVTDFEAAESVRHIHDAFLEKEFKNHFNANPSLFEEIFAESPEGLSAVREALDTPYDESAKLMDLFVTILGAFNADVAEKYRSFLKSSFKPMPLRPRPVPAATPQGAPVDAILEDEQSADQSEEQEIEVTPNLPARTKLARLFGTSLNNLNAKIRSKLKKYQYNKFIGAGKTIIWITTLNRIGHLCTETDCLLKETIMTGDDTTRFALVDNGLGFANPHLLKYFEKYIAVIRNGPIAEMVQELGIDSKDVLQTHPYCVAINQTARAYEVYANWGKRPPLFELSTDDKDHLRSYLRHVGVPVGAWYVCLHAREGGYSEWDEKYHKFRSVDINSLSLATDEIIRRGGWCIRMGDASMQPYAPHPQVIDYALSLQKTARLDVVLSAGCRFFLGSCSGLSNVAEAFGLPCVVAHMAPLACAYAPGPATISLPQRLQDKSGRIMSFSEIMNDECANYRMHEQFVEKGLQNIPSSAEDILDAVLEMFDRLDGTVVYTDDDVRRQEEFRSYFRPGHYAYGTASSIGRDFLRKNMP